MTEQISFCVLLPIKIEGDSLSDLQQTCIESLAASLSRPSTRGFNCRVVLGIDEEQKGHTVVDHLHHIFELTDVKVSKTWFPGSLRGRICDFWRIMADKAIEEGADFFVLLGDDVEIHSDDWIETIVCNFHKMHEDLRLPQHLFGFGCIALKDLQAPGFPTFPVLHKLHYKLNGEIFSTIFVNQDADPFLFQLYRRWGAARFSDATITNRCGGVQLQDNPDYIAPRYQRHHVDWKNDLLDETVLRISKSLRLEGWTGPRVCTIDVIVPSFRVKREFLERICSLKAQPSVDVMFLIIVDNPNADIKWLRSLEASRTDIRVRVNTENMGASLTRNVGLDESASEWILFLDDDVIPRPDIIDQYAKAALEHFPIFYGFVGYSELPNEVRVFAVAVHLSSVSFFWRAAKKLPFVPWGVTANLFVRRTGARFDPKYLKTGGGEDIDFCLKLPRQPLMSTPDAVVVHPWWDNGARCYPHFFNWSFSDGILQDEYPRLTYRTAPDAVESALLLGTMAFARGAAIAGLWYGVSSGLRAGTACLLADFLMDLPIFFDRSKEPYASGILRLAATFESTLIKNYSCVGRLWGHLRRGNLKNICKRFDWFCGQDTRVVHGEQMKAAQKSLGFLVAVSIAFSIF